jgi:hypothetical protein
MSISKARCLSAGLEGVRRRFERWRRTHKARRRIPDRLWAAAVRAAGTCGLHRTSKALRLDYYSLKERVEQQATAAPDPAERAAALKFLELTPPAEHASAAVPAGACECTLELEDAGGAKMRVHLRGVATPDLAALSRSFWNPAP